MCRTPLPVAPPGCAVPWTPGARCRRRRMHAGHSSGNPLPLSVCATVRLSCAFPVAGTWPGRVRDAMAEPRIAPTPHAGIRARPDERRPRQVSRRLVAASRWVPGPTSVAACGSQCGLRTDSAQTRDGSPTLHAPRRQHVTRSATRAEGHEHLPSLDRCAPGRKLPAHEVATTGAERGRDAGWMRPCTWRGRARVKPEPQTPQGVTAAVHRADSCPTSAPSRPGSIRSRRKVCGLPGTAGSHPPVPGCR